MACVVAALIPCNDVILLSLIHICDIDFGIYPYTTSSNVIGAYAPSGAGIPGHKLNNSVGVMKMCIRDRAAGLSTMN